MRDRLLAAFVTLTVLIVALYGIPRAYQVAGMVRAQEERKIERSVDLVAVVLAEHLADGDVVTEEYLEPMLNQAETLRYVAPDGTETVAGPRFNPAPSDIVMSRDVDGGGTVTLTRAGGLIDERVSEAVYPLVAIGVGLVLVSAGVAVVVARRLARPFGELAASAERLGRGQFDLDVPRYAVPEADQIGASMRTAAERLADVVRREREFSANASHQLRTPVTALRLQLEDISLWPETPESVREELQHSLGELDRLSGAVTELLAMSRGRLTASAVELDLADLVDAAVARWSVLAPEGRRVVPDAGGPVPCQVAAGPVGQILDVLVDNALKHGAGTVTVSARDEGTHLAVAVENEGARPTSSDLFRRRVSGSSSGGEGIGLAVARDLAGALGGRLALAPGTTTAFVLELPRSPARDASGGHGVSGTISMAPQGHSSTHRPQPLQ
ncbi:signal transduction histidine kinase [Georgenia soli]|uniref:histidine kinase n=1 Tax=Georgenia soli TaxID=638953 RepID=A0A2A9EHG4_9MICO|nr:HAMP domain-containing sensor histidine kinase [Georgenia soli]PFG38283.1 signal transduction histidine kinase [Georgenia soli]